MSVMSISNYIDRDGFLKSHIFDDDASGDGIILTVVGGILGVLPAEHVDSAVLACIDPRGALLRRPDNSGGHQSHDGWQSLATWVLHRNYTVLARGLLLSGLTRLFYMKHHEFGFEGKTLWKKLDELLKPWMGRFPRIWITLLAAAYPNRYVFWLCSRLLRMMTSVSSVPSSDASACQLKFVDCFAMQAMGLTSPMASYLAAFRSKGTSLAEIMSAPIGGGLPFWDRDHYVITGFSSYERKVVK